MIVRHATVVGTVRNLVRALSLTSVMLVTSVCKTLTQLLQLLRPRVKQLISWVELSQSVITVLLVVSVIEVLNSQDLAHQVNTTTKKVRMKNPIAWTAQRPNIVMVCQMMREPTFSLI